MEEGAKGIICLCGRLVCVKATTVLQYIVLFPWVIASQISFLLYIFETITPQYGAVKAEDPTEALRLGLREPDSESNKQR